MRVSSNVKLVVPSKNSVGIAPVAVMARRAEDTRMLTDRSDLVPEGIMGRHSDSCRGPQRWLGAVIAGGCAVPVVL